MTTRSSQLTDINLQVTNITDNSRMRLDGSNNLQHTAEISHRVKAKIPATLVN